MKITSRLKKVNNSFALGDTIPAGDQVVALITRQYPQLTDSNLIKDQGKEAMWGGVSDAGTSVAELYCFRLDTNDIIGVLVSQGIKIIDSNKYQFDKVGNYQVLQLNINRKNGKVFSGGENILELKNKITSDGVILNGMNETFKNGFNSIEQACDQFKDKAQEQII